MNQAAKVRLDKTDESSELADLQNEIANLIEEKEAAIRQQDFEAAARLRIKEKIDPTADGSSVYGSQRSIRLCR